MIVVHTNWFEGKLHVWGERASRAPDSSGPSRTVEAPTPGVAPVETLPSCDTYSAAVGENELRDRLGEVFDSLLVANAESGELTLRLPFRGRVPISSKRVPEDSDRAQHDSPIELCTRRIGSLVFAPADTIDLLTGGSAFGAPDLVEGDSLRFWSCVGMLVLELLARERFVPAIHQIDAETFRGYWRAVVDDRTTSQRLEALVEAMPPVCRAMNGSPEPIQASRLIENFLWVNVDALVRRCLEGDDLAHAILERRDDPSPQMCWLRSVVGTEPLIEGPSGQGGQIKKTVQRWLSRLDSNRHQRTYKTCFQLHAPSAEDVSDTEWKLTLHAQSLADPKIVFDATTLMGKRSDDPAILRDPFDDVEDQLRKDVTTAARHFPALVPCAEMGGPMQLILTVDQAYAFLREAAPILESEGFGVRVPEWWHEKRTRLRFWLDVAPAAKTADDGVRSIGLDALIDYDWRLALGKNDLSEDELEQLMKNERRLVRIHGHWTEVQPAEMKAALSFLREKRTGRMTFAEVLRESFLADDLDTGIPFAGLRAQGWLEGFLTVTKSFDQVEKVDAPPDFVGSLRPYQLRGLEWLAFLDRLKLGACLADDMGLGKTIQLIALLLHERRDERRPGPTLLVVPMSLVGNWQREIARFAPSLKTLVHHGLDRLTGDAFVKQAREHDVVISTYGLSHRDLEHLSVVEWHRIVLDEAQNIKNPASKQSLAVRAIPSEHRVVLTGTPVENRLTELWSILDFLNPGYLGSGGEFRRRFAVPIERYHDEDRAHRLRQLIRPFVLRRLKSDPSVEVDLPEKMEMKVYCNLTKEQAALYEAVVGNMMKQIDHAGGIQRRGLILATLVKLKQVCNHPAHFLGDGSSIENRSGKCERLGEMMEEVLAEGDRALIFTQFRVMGDLLEPWLAKRFGIEMLFLHGGTTRPKRDKLVERFQEENPETPILLLSLKAGGYGLNLTAANHVFHFDRWWNPAVEDQATDRVHRIGQIRRVQVYKYVCIGTLEERIDSLLERKRKLAENIVGGGENWLTELSTDQLRDLFALSRDAVADS